MKVVSYTADASDESTESVIEHHSYHTEDTTDLSVIRKQAMERAQGKGPYRGNAHSTLVHVHPHESPCTMQQHELYLVTQLG